jgi:hypothetical protein
MERIPSDVIKIILLYLEPVMLCRNRIVSKTWDNIIKELISNNKQILSIVPLHIKYLCPFSKIKKIKLWNTLENNDFAVYLKNFTCLKKLDITNFNTNIETIYAIYKIPLIMGSKGFMVNGHYVLYASEYLLLEYYDSEYVYANLEENIFFDHGKDIKNITLAVKEQNRNLLLEIFHKLISKNKMVKKISLRLHCVFNSSMSSKYINGVYVRNKDTLKYIDNTLLATLEHLKKLEFHGIEMIDNDAFVPNLEVYKIRHGKWCEIIDSFPNRINDMKKLIKYDVDSMGNLVLEHLYKSTIKKIYCDDSCLLESGLYLKQKLESVGFKNVFTEKFLEVTFEHYQVLNFVKKISISFIEHHNNNGNNIYFNAIFRNYANFFLEKISFDIGDWKINHFINCIVKNDKTFLSNIKLNKIIIQFRWHNPNKFFKIPIKISLVYRSYIETIKNGNQRKIYLIRK